MRQALLYSWAPRVLGEDTEEGSLGDWAGVLKVAGEGLHVRNSLGLHEDQWWALPCSVTIVFIVDGLNGSQLRPPLCVEHPRLWAGGRGHPRTLHSPSLTCESLKSVD